MITKEAHLARRVAYIHAPSSLSNQRKKWRLAEIHEAIQVNKAATQTTHSFLLLFCLPTWKFPNFSFRFCYPGNEDRHSVTGPHSPVLSRDAPVYVEEYTTTYTKTVRSTEHLDSIPKDPEPLRFPHDFESLDDGRPHSFAFDDLDKDSSLPGFNSDRFDFGSSGNGSPRRSKSLSSFQDADDEDYGFVAVPYTKSPTPKMGDRAGRVSTRGGTVLKSIEKWETESYSTSGNLYRSSSEKRLNGVDHSSKR